MPGSSELWGRLVNWRSHQTPKYPWSKGNLDVEHCPSQEITASSLERPPEGIESSNIIEIVFAQITKHHSLPRWQPHTTREGCLLPHHCPPHPCAEIGSYPFPLQRKWNVGFINITTIRALHFFFLSNTSLHPSPFMEHWKMLERDKHLDIFDFCSPKFTNPKRTINCHPAKYDSNSSGIFKGPLGHIRVNGDSGSWENTNETVIDAENGLTWLWLPWKPIFLIYGFFSSLP